MRDAQFDIELNGRDMKCIRWPSVERNAATIPREIELREATNDALCRTRDTLHLMLPDNRYATESRLSMATFFDFIDRVPRGKKVGEAIWEFLEESEGI